MHVVDESGLQFDLTVESRNPAQRQLTRVEMKRLKTKKKGKKRKVRGWGNSYKPKSHKKKKESPELSAAEQVSILKAQVRGLQVEVSDLTARNAFLEGRMAELERQLESEKTRAQLLEEANTDLLKEKKLLDKVSHVQKVREWCREGKEGSARSVRRHNGDLHDIIKAFAQEMCHRLGTTYGDGFTFTDKGFQVRMGKTTFEHDICGDRRKWKRSHAQEPVMAEEDCELSAEELAAAAKTKEEKAAAERIARDVRAFSRFKDEHCLSYVGLQNMINFVNGVTGRSCHRW
jgi:hypothetical protein